MENDKRKKRVHRAAKGKKQSSKGPAALNTKPALKKQSTYGKRKESDEHNIDEYIKYHSDLKPSSKQRTIRFFWTLPVACF